MRKVIFNQCSTSGAAKKKGGGGIRNHDHDGTEHGEGRNAFYEESEKRENGEYGHPMIGE
jgi:hypothetical protein